MTLVRVVNTPQVDQALIWLLTFYDPANNVDLRACNNLEDITSNGNVFTAFPFEVVLPPEDGQRIAKMQLVFPNVGRELMQLVREYPPGFYPSIKFELVISDDPDTVEKTIDFMVVQNADYTSTDVTFNLTSSNIFARKTQVATYNQSEFPGLFWGLK